MASEGPTNSAEVFALPDAQLKELSEKASHGDCPAAQRVADYYSFSRGDIKGAIPWMRIAASVCAESSAKANLVTILLTIDPHILRLTNSLRSWRQSILYGLEI